MTELKPCPFCGGEAQIMRMDLDSIEEGWKVWGIWCVPDLHAEEHGGCQHGHFIDNYATKEQAIEAWNARAERTCERDGTIPWRGPAVCYEHELSCHVVTTTDPEPPNFCEECGAKVRKR